jgi:hypothetical protein
MEWRVTWDWRRSSMEPCRPLGCRWRRKKATRQQAIMKDSSRKKTIGEKRAGR